MYLSEQEKRHYAVICSNIDFFNSKNPRWKITARLYIDNGNRIDLNAITLKTIEPSRPILHGVTLEQALYCTAAINNYMEASQK